MDSGAALDEIARRLTRQPPPLLIGVDGLGAAGKSTFADRLSQRLDAQVVHVDEFNQPGVHPWEVHRFLAEVWRPYVHGRPARYRRWHWTQAEPGEWAEVAPGRALILEGVRSTDLAVTADFALRVWLEVPEQVRRERARLRDPDRHACWTTNWMPIEQAWFLDQRPDLQADIIVDHTQ